MIFIIAIAVAKKISLGRLVRRAMRCVWRMRRYTAPWKWVQCDSTWCSTRASINGTKCTVYRLCNCTHYRIKALPILLSERNWLWFWCSENDALRFGDGPSSRRNRFALSMAHSWRRLSIISIWLWQIVLDIFEGGKIHPEFDRWNDGECVCASIITWFYLRVRMFDSTGDHTMIVIAERWSAMPHQMWWNRITQRSHLPECNGNDDCRRTATFIMTKK